MDLSTEYMGLALKNPVVLAASPLARDLGAVRRLEDAGAAAITMHSLFEEQVTHDAEALSYFLDIGKDRYAESLSDFPEEAIEVFKTGADEYLEHLAKVKASVGVPVIGSLNGTTAGGWTDYARKIEQAGADALEINLYIVATDPGASGADVEAVYLDALRAVKGGVGIPVAMKLSPYFSSMAHMAAQLDDAGADGLVLFNRFYQPVIDADHLAVRPDLALSAPEESRLPLRWIAILHGRVKASLAATSGIHDAGAVVQAVMAGADVAEVCSAVLAGGPEKVRDLIDGLGRWMAEHEYESVAAMRGTLSQASCPDPAAFERANYMKTLGSYR